MTEAEGSRGELVQDGRVDVLVVILAESILEREHAELLHLVTPDDDRQPFVVSNVLHLSDQDAPRLLVNALVVPIRIQIGQLFGKSVVLAQEDGVSNGQVRLFIRA